MLIYEIYKQGKRSFPIKFGSNLFKGGDRKDKRGGEAVLTRSVKITDQGRGVGDKVPKVLGNRGINKKETVFHSLSYTAKP